MSVNLMRTSGSLNAEALSDGLDPPHLKDERFVSLSRVPQQPTNTIDQKTAQFRLPPCTDLYLIDDIKISLKCRIVTKSLPHTTPLPGTLVGPVNNVLHSCIRDVKMTFNNVCGKYFILKSKIKYNFFF